MSLDDIRKIDRPWLLAREVAPVLQMEAHSIRLQAHHDASRLGFPVIITGRRVRIPKAPFLAFMEGKAE